MNPHWLYMILGCFQNYFSLGLFNPAAHQPVAVIFLLASRRQLTCSGPRAVSNLGMKFRIKAMAVPLRSDGDSARSGVTNHSGIFPFKSTHSVYCHKSVM
jgi:hypothetical protein